MRPTRGRRASRRRRPPGLRACRRPRREHAPDAAHHEPNAALAGGPDPAGTPCRSRRCRTRTLRQGRRSFPARARRRRPHHPSALTPLELRWRCALKSATPRSTSIALVSTRDRYGAASPPGGTSRRSPVPDALEFRVVLEAAGRRHERVGDVRRQLADALGVRRVQWQLLEVTAAAWCAGTATRRPRSPPLRRPRPPRGSSRRT